MARGIRCIVFLICNGIAWPSASGQQIQQGVDISGADKVIPLYEVKTRQADTEEKKVNAKGELTHVWNVSVPRLLVYQPDRVCGTAIIVCPGGGYKRLNVENTRYIARRLNALGITVFVLVHRLPGGQDSALRHTVALVDVQESMRLVHARASEWGLSTDRIGLWGSSAGGHLAAMAATGHMEFAESKGKSNDVRPDFLILAWPVISFRPELVHEGSMRNLLGDTPTASQRAAFSPDEWVDEKTPETYLVHAGDDSAVSVNNSIRFYQALHKLGISAELHIYEKGGHGFGIAPDVSNSWMDLLAIWLRDRGLL